MSALKKYFASRASIHRTAGVVGAVCIIIGFSVGISTLQSDASNTHTTATQSMAAFASAWQTRISTRIGQGISLAASAGAFAQGGAAGPANMSLPGPQRLLPISPSQWSILGDALFAAVPGILSLQLQSGGVLSQCWPPGSGPIGFDVWNSPANRANYISLVNGKVPAAAGPVGLVQGGLGVLARFPVYTNATKTFNDFWGAGVAVFRISDMLAAMNFSASIRDAGYSFVVYARVVANASSPRQLILWSGDVANETIMSSGLTVLVPTQDPANGLYVSLLKVGGIPSDSPSGQLIAEVVLVTLAATVALLLIGYALVVASFFARHSALPHQSSDATDTYMALVAIKNIGWWTEHREPEAWHGDLQKFDKIVASDANAHGCYSAGRINDGCCIVVASSPESLIEFAKAVTQNVPQRMSGLSVSKVNPARSAAYLSGSADDRQSGAQSRASTPRAARRRQTMNKVGRMSESHGSGGNDTTTIHSTMGPRSVECAVAIHVGPLKAMYREDDDRYEFHGPGVSKAAMAVDATAAGEVSATEALAEDARLPTMPTNTTSRTNDSDVTIYVLERGAGSAAAAGATGKQSAMMLAATGSDSGVASAVVAQTGEVLRKRVAVCCVELPKLAYNTPVAALADVSLVHDAAKRYGGDVLGCRGTRVVLVFNAFSPVASAPRRAAAFDTFVRNHVSLSASRHVVSSIAFGPAHVAMLNMHPVCYGEVVSMAESMCDYACRVAEADHVFRSCIVDANSAGDLRHTYELQCVGPVDAAFADSARRDAAGLLHAIMDEWPEADNDDEWLYKLQQLEEQSPYEPLNRAFACLEQGVTDLNSIIAGLERERLHQMSATALAYLKRVTQSPGGRPIDGSAAGRDVVESLPGSAVLRVQ